MKTVAKRPNVTNNLSVTQLHDFNGFICLHAFGLGHKNHDFLFIISIVLGLLILQIKYLYSKLH